MCCCDGKQLDWSLITISAPLAINTRKEPNYGPHHTPGLNWEWRSVLLCACVCVVGGGAGRSKYGQLKAVAGWKLGCQSRWVGSGVQVYIKCAIHLYSFSPGTLSSVFITVTKHIRATMLQIKAQPFTQMAHEWRENHMCDNIRHRLQTVAVCTHMCPAWDSPSRWPAHRWSQGK